MDKIFGIIFTETPWWLLLGLAIYGLSWSVYGDLWKPGSEAATARNRWCRDLRENYWSNWYDRQLTAALNWIDGKLGDDVDEKARPYATWRNRPRMAWFGRRFGGQKDAWLSRGGGAPLSRGSRGDVWPSKACQRAWSFPLFNIVMAVAVAYPIGLLLLQWVVTGDPARLGTVVVIESGPPALLRCAIPVSLVFGVVMMLSTAQQPEPRDRLERNPINLDRSRMR
ncbi:MAG: hypothetical protein AAF675_19840 [Pseudomonadota bacterium]